MVRRSSRIGKYRRILEVDPESLESILSRIHDGDDTSTVEVQLAAADWEKLIQIIKHQLDSLEDPDCRTFAISVVAEIYEGQLADLERAFRFWGQMLPGRPDDELVYHELERLAESLGSWRALVQIYNAALKRLDPAAQRKVLFKLARVHREELDELSQAERVYLSLLHKNREDGDALAALDDLYSQTQRNEDLPPLLRRRIAAAADLGERSELRLRLGYLYDIELEDPDLAVEAYRSVLQEDPGSEQALKALEQIFLRQERWNDLLSLYERRIAAARSQGEAAALLLRMANISEEALEDHELSVEIWKRLLALRSDDHALLAEMARRFQALKRWEELAQVFEQQAELTPDPTVKARLYQEEGRLWGDLLGRDQQALACWNRVLALEPDSVPALLALTDLHQRAGAGEELLATLQRLSDLAEQTGQEAPFRRELYARIGQLEASTFARPGAAIEAWYRVLEIDPDDGEALDALVELLAQEGRWLACVDILERKVARAGEEERIGQLLRLAEIWRDGLDDAEEAIRAYDRVRELDPDDETALEALRTLYRTQGRWEDFAALCFTWLESVQDPRQAVGLLQEVAAIYEEQLEQADKAFVVWQTAFREDRGNEVTTANLERLALALGEQETLLALYEEAVLTPPDARFKIGLLVTMSRWTLELHGEADRAIYLASQSLHLDSEHIPALEALAEGYRRAGRWPELAGALKRHADLERNPLRAAELLCALGELLDASLGDQNQAIATYQRALQLAPGQPRALDALEELYRRGEQWLPLLEILQQQVACTTDQGRIIACRLQMGEILAGPLAAEELAIQAFRAILVLDPHHLAALGALEGLYEAQGESEAYLDIMERKLELSPSEERLALYPRIAEAWESQLDRPDRAIACLEKLLELDRSSAETYERLADLCRRIDDHHRLVAVTQRHIAAVREQERRIALYLVLGDTFINELGDADRAVMAYNSALALEPGQIEALDALARLYEKLGNWERASEVLGRLAPLVEEIDRCLIFFHQGRIAEEELAQPERAIACYEQALAVDDTHFDSMTRLAELYKARADWPRAVALMIRAAPLTGNPLRRCQLLYEAGTISLEHLQQEEQGVELLLQTLRYDPDHLQAGLPLSRIYFREGRHDLLEPILDMLARKVDGRDRQLRHEICSMLGQTAAALGKIEKGIRCHAEARSLEPNHLPTLKALSALQYQAGEWAEAFKTYQTLLIHHRTALAVAEVVEIFFRLGKIKTELGERRKAINYFEKALEEDSSHRPSIRSLIDLRAAASDWRAVIEAKTALIATADEEERFELLVECGDIQHQRLGAMDKAIEAYQAAVDLRPGDRALLHKLMEVLTEATRWKEVVEVLLLLTEIERDPAFKANYYHTAAIICRDALEVPDRAIEFFNLCLDHAPEELKAFEAIDRLCTQGKNWSALEQHYRLMIGRLDDARHRGLKAMLWHNLGEIYRSRIQRQPEAIAAFEESLRLQPEEMQRCEILAELYQAAGPDYAARAVATHQALIAHSPTRLESYRALRGLFISLGQADSAWCICAALGLLNAASEEERRFFAQHRRPSPPRPRRSISPELWNECIQHHDQERLVGLVLALIAPVVQERTARPHKEFGLKRRALLGADGSGSPLVLLAGQLAAVLGMATPDIYLMREAPADLVVANTTGSPALVVGSRLAQGVDERELAFLLGQHLTYLRPQFLLTRLIPSAAGLRSLLLAALRLIDPALPIEPGDRAEVERLAGQLAAPLASRPDLRQGLASLAPALAGRAANLDLNRWWNSLQLTANRIGLILCADLPVAARIIETEPAVFGQMAARDKIRDLLVYGVSPEYLRVRGELGLTIGHS